MSSSTRRASSQAETTSRSARYFFGESLELFEEVLQVARQGLVDQVLDAGIGYQWT